MSHYQPNEELLKKLDCKFKDKAVFIYNGTYKDYLGREESKYMCRECFFHCSTSQKEHLNLKDSLFS